MQQKAVQTESKQCHSKVVDCKVTVHSCAMECPLSILCEQGRIEDKIMLEVLGGRLGGEPLGGCYGNVVLGDISEFRSLTAYGKKLLLAVLVLMLPDELSA